MQPAKLVDAEAGAGWNAERDLADARAAALNQNNENHGKQNAGNYADQSCAIHFENPFRGSWVELHSVSAPSSCAADFGLSGSVRCWHRTPPQEIHRRSN